MFTKALLQFEQHRMVLDGPEIAAVGVLRSPAVFPLWLAAWGGMVCLMSLLDSARGTVDCPGAALLFQTAKQALHMGHTLLGAYENGDRNVLREAIDFAMDREFLATIYDDLQRVLDDCAHQIADKIADCDATRGLVITFVIASNIRLFGLLSDAGDFPLAPMMIAFLRTIELRVVQIQCTSSIRGGSACAGLGELSGSSCDPAP
eukprot:s845_g11.t1